MYIWRVLSTFVWNLHIYKHKYTCTHYMHMPTTFSLSLLCPCSHMWWLEVDINMSSSIALITSLPYIFFEIGSRCVVLTSLELAMYTRLILTSQKSVDLSWMLDWKACTTMPGHITFFLTGEQVLRVHLSQLPSAGVPDTWCHTHLLHMCQGFKLRSSWLHYSLFSGISRPCL